MGVSLDRMRLVPVGVDPELFTPLPGRRPRARPADHHRLGRRRPEGPRLPARGDGQAAHRARRHADHHRQAASRQEHGPASSSSACAAYVDFVSAACPTSASSSCTPRPSWPSCRASTRGSACRRSRRWHRHLPRRHRRRRPARGHRPRRRDRAAVPRPATPRRWPRPSAAASTTRELRARDRRRRASAGRRALELAALRRAHRRAVPRGAGHAAERRQAAPRTARLLMLTIRFDATRAAAGRPRARRRRGFGRHAFELRRAAAPTSSPSTTPPTRSIDTRNTFAAMAEAGEVADRPLRRRPAGRRHPAAVRRRHVRPRHHARCSSTSRTTSRRSPSWPGCCSPAARFAATVPTWLPEKINWMLSDEYHAPKRRRRPRAHLHAPPS